ncbi:MAG: DUF4340 domain-containing protein [Verrucomicrobiales bacterium]|nr:DUF4340 domain-containing protein [Verrucomicrobiales bacterium]MCP5557259.1 DUF4340 domain-containing protein [Verrucomicrobiaceae bacterium]
MKRVVILLAVLVGLVGLSLLMKSRRTKTLTAATMREFLLPDLAKPEVVNGIKKVHVKTKDAEATVEVAGDAWVVAERSGFRADGNRVARALDELRDMKIQGVQRLGKSAWGDVDVLAPGSDEKGTGTLVELINGKGDVMHTFVIGGTVDSKGAQDSSPMFGGGSERRFVRLPSDNDSIWMVANGFVDLTGKPADWLDKSFFAVQKVKSVEVTAPKPEDSYKAARASQEGETFQLAEAKAGEVYDEAKAGFSSLLNGPSFEDVEPKDKAGELLKGATKIKVTTFDGFTYDIQVAKVGEGTGAKHYMMVNVSADIAKERPPVKDEKPEDKKKADEAFAAQKKSLEDKLAAEKKVEGWIYQVGEFVANPLLKKRSEIVADPPKEMNTPVPGATPGTADSLPSGVPGLSGLPGGAPAQPKLPVSVTTPPVSVPPLPKEPAKLPDAAPTPGPKPAAPAAAPAPDASAPEAKPAPAPAAK